MDWTMLASALSSSTKQQQQQQQTMSSGNSAILYMITNGGPDDMRSIPNVNATFSATRTCPRTKKSKHGVVTPLVMKLNQFRNWKHPTVQMLLSLGADPTMQIDYYGTSKSALKIFGPIDLDVVD